LNRLVCGVIFFDHKENHSSWLCNRSKLNLNFTIIIYFKSGISEVFNISHLEVVVLDVCRIDTSKNLASGIVDNTFGIVLISSGLVERIVSCREAKSVHALELEVEVWHVLVYNRVFLIIFELLCYHFLDVVVEGGFLLSGKFKKRTIDKALVLSGEGADGTLNTRIEEEVDDPLVFALD